MKVLAMKVLVMKVLVDVVYRFDILAIQVLRDVKSVRRQSKSMKTNTRQIQSYDNIAFDTSRTSEFMSQSGVVNLLHECGPAMHWRAVSDHIPDCALFSDRESTAAVLTQEPVFIR